MKDKNPMKNPKTAQKVQEKLKGRKLTNEQRQNMSQSHKKKILCIDTGQIFESRQAAAEFYHVSPSGIGRAAKGEQLTSAGKRWKYLK